jgi:hypothetical protein
MLCPVVHLLDVAVERAGLRPLGREMLRRALGDEDRHAIETGTVSSEMTASSGLIQNMIAMTPMIVHSAVMSWVSVC